MAKPRTTCVTLTFESFDQEMLRDTMPLMGYICARYQANRSNKQGAMERTWQKLRKRHVWSWYLSISPENRTWHIGCFCDKYEAHPWNFTDRQTDRQTDSQIDKHRVFIELLPQIKLLLTLNYLVMGYDEIYLMFFKNISEWCNKSCISHT